MKTPTNTLISSYRLNIPGFLHLAWTANKISCHQGMHFRSLLCSKEGNYFFFPLSHVYSWKKFAKWIFVPFFFRKSFAAEEIENLEHTAKNFLSRTEKVTLTYPTDFENWSYLKVLNVFLTVRWTYTYCHFSNSVTPLVLEGKSICSVF